MPPGCTRGNELIRSPCPSFSVKYFLLAHFLKCLRNPLEKEGLKLKHSPRLSRLLFRRRSAVSKSCLQVFQSWHWQQARSNAAMAGGLSSSRTSLRGSVGSSRVLLIQKSSWSVGMGSPEGLSSLSVTSEME